MKNISFVKVLALVLSYFFVTHLASAQISNVKSDGTIKLINSTVSTKYNLIIDVNGKVGIGTTAGEAAIENVGLVMKGAVAIVGSTSVTPFTVSATRAQNYSLFVEKGVVSEDFVIAAATTWSDFVFENGYQLQPLNEVENFVSEHKHLPGIPSANDVKEGYGMHEMNKLFLQKIEELTLYAIDQDKKVKELENTVLMLTKKMEAK